MQNDINAEPANNRLASRVEASIAQLVRSAGRRVVPNLAVEQQSFDVVRAAWHDALHQRRQQLRVKFAAGVAVTLIVVAIGGVWRSQTAATSLAVVADVRGVVQQRHDNAQIPAVAVGANLVRGDELFTTLGGKALLRRESGLTVLLGPSTRVTWESANELRLQSGVLYVDTGAAAPLGEKTGGQIARPAHDDLTILTHAGRIRHVGTQFSVDARATQIRVAVRDGMVTLKTGNAEARLARGDHVRISDSGALVRERSASDIAQPSGPWDWLTLRDPQFAIENRVLSDVVRDIADASGVELLFASADIERQAQSLVLHGPPLKLAPLTALDAVLLTTQLQANRQQDRVQIDVRP